jgi:hypothetical protein
MKIFALLLGLLFAIPAHAHILLTTAYDVTGPTGFATSSAPNATAISTSFTWSSTGNVACITYAFGTATFSGGLDTGFTVQASAPTVTNCLNLTTGAWAAGITNGPLLQSGTLTGANLTAAIATYTGPATALRDAADFFASTTFLPGTQPDLWGSGDL